MASKTLLRTGASLLNRFSNSFLHESPHSYHQIASHGHEISPKLFSSISKLPSNDDEPMLLFPKRTFQPSLIRRKRNHGFFARKATRGGRRVIARRIAKGRSRITA